MYFFKLGSNYCKVPSTLARLYLTVWTKFPSVKWEIVKRLLFENLRLWCAIWTIYMLTQSGLKSLNLPLHKLYSDSLDYPGLYWPNRAKVKLHNGCETRRNTDRPNKCFCWFTITDTLPYMSIYAPNSTM